MSEEKIAVKISGYIPFDIELEGKIYGDALSNYKCNFNAEESLHKDLIYRCEDVEVVEGINIDDFDEGYENDAFQTWVFNYLKSEIERNQVPIVVVEFDPYYEDGKFMGWDYIATLKLDWETLWDRWNKRNEI